MGNLFSGSAEGVPAGHDDASNEGFRMLVSGVYVMHEPGQGQVPDMDIVFFHGLQLGDYKKAYKDTWESSAGGRGGRKVCWPRDWLGQDFPNARILSISYDSSMLGSEGGGKQPIFSLVKGLLDKLMNLVKIGDGRPVVFVGHSLGGLIIKRLCVEMRGNSLDSNAHRSLLNNVRGVFFYATPHGGASLANLALGTMGNFVNFSPVMKFLATNESANVVELNAEFFKVWNYTKCQTKALAETKPTLHQGKVVVNLISSSQNALIPVVAIDDVDHISICKPKSKNTETYVYLKDFIESVVKMDANDPTKYPERIVEAIRSEGPEMLSMLKYINKSLEGKEGKTEEQSTLEKAELAKELVRRGVIPCIVEVMKSLETGRNSAGVVSEAGWALDNLLEYGADTSSSSSSSSSFFAQAVDAGAVDALVAMLGTHQTAHSALCLLRNLTDEYPPCHSLLSKRLSDAKLPLQNFSYSDKSPPLLREASTQILTNMDWHHSTSSPSYPLLTGGPIIEED